MEKLKENFINALNKQVSEGKKYKELANSAASISEIDQVYSAAVSWDRTNKDILRDGTIVRQLLALYLAKESLGNAFDDKHSFKYKRDFVTASIGAKIPALEMIVSQSNMYKNQDFLPFLIPTKPLNEEHKNKMKKVFISHSSKDNEIIKPLIYLLQEIGLAKEQIFYSSHPAYGVSPGENILERIKFELSENDLVLFILSENFYNSPVCLCEMGAVWIKTTKHIPMLIPPFSHKDIKGAIPNTTIALKISDKDDINSLQNTMHVSFNTKSLHATEWEERRDKYLAEVGSHLNKLMGGLGNLI